MLRRWGNGGNLLKHTDWRFRYDVDGNFLKVPEEYVGFVEELPGANTQGKALQEARDNIREAIESTFEATIYVNRAAQRVSAVPRYRELNRFCALGICRDLGVPTP